MKKLFFETPYWPFFITGLLALCVAAIFRGIYPSSVFDVSVYNYDLYISNARVWFGFACYLFFLAAIYYVISVKEFKARRWLVTSHYVFILAFMVFFALFSSFGSPLMRELTGDLPFVTLISIYAIIFLTDVLCFAVGLLLLVVNLITMRKMKDL